MARRTYPPGSTQVLLSPLFFVIAIICFILFISGFSQNGNSIPTCAGAQMSPGDECTFIQSGTSTTETYSEMQQNLQNNNQNAPLFLLASLVSLGVGITLWVSGKKARNT